MSTALDLDSFPLLRLDQLTLASDALLEAAIEGVGELLELEASSDDGTLGNYLHRQLIKMREEVERRKEQDSTGTVATVVTTAATNEQGPQVRQRKPATGNNARSIHHLDGRKHNRSTGAMKAVGWYRASSAPQLHSTVPVAVTQTATAVPFVVEATEPKRRMLPKKTPKITREEKLDAERAVRREMALERLRSRKLQRQNQQAQRMLRKSMKTSTRPRSASLDHSKRPEIVGGGHLSSDSESVSGGDDEMDENSDLDGDSAVVDLHCGTVSQPALASDVGKIALCQQSFSGNSTGSGMTVIDELVHGPGEQHALLDSVACEQSGDTIKHEEAAEGDQTNHHAHFQEAGNTAVMDSLLALQNNTDHQTAEEIGAVNVQDDRTSAIAASSQLQHAKTIEDHDKCTSVDSDCMWVELRGGPNNQETLLGPSAPVDRNQVAESLYDKTPPCDPSTPVQPKSTPRIDTYAFSSGVEGHGVADSDHIISSEAERENGAKSAESSQDTSLPETNDPTSPVPQLGDKAIEPSCSSFEPSSKCSMLEQNESASDAVDLIVEDNNITKRATKYSAYYPSFFHLFSGLYCAAGEISVESTTYCTLTAALEQQLSLYQEWIAIMKDFELVTQAPYAPTPLAATDSNFGYDQYFRVNSSRAEVSRIIKDAMSSSDFATGWHELPEGLGLKTTWNLLWTWSKPRISSMHLLECQRVNHFTEIRNLTRKDLLKKHIERWSRLGEDGKQFQIMPLTFWLPHEYTSFVSKFSQSGLRNQRNVWIMKPIGLSRGRGISLVHDINDLVYSQEVVIQQYISNPLLLDGYKFDLRLYVLVTSFQPLEVFIYKEGFARLSTRKYCIDTDKLGDLLIHLTNSSIQTVNEGGIEADNPVATTDIYDSGGTKLSLTETWRRLKLKGFDTSLLWQRACEVVVKSLVCIDDKIPHQPSAFELFGYDVIFDDTLQPWLLEVNSSPSMARGSALDRRIKDAVIRDTIALVNPLPYDRVALVDVLTRRVSDVRKKGPAVFTKADPALEEDLADIFKGQLPRTYGEIPSQMGNFERLCPGTRIYSQSIQLRRRLARLGPLPAKS